MIKIVVGHSEDVEALDCVTEILEQCRMELGERIPQAGVVYNAIHMDHQKVLDTIMDAFPNLELIGCTTDGEISSILGCVEDSITLILFYSDSIEIRAGMGKNLSDNANQTAMDAIGQAEESMSKTPAFCITLAESVTVGGVSVINALKNNLGHEFPIFGGLAADQWSMKKTYQFYKREIVMDTILVLLFAGNIIFSSGLASGWTPIGHKKKITKVDHNIVYEVDQEPILDFYNRYVGGNYKRVPTEYPLAIFPNENSEKYYIRSPYTFNEADRSVTFFGDVPEGVIVQLVSGSIEKMSIASEAALKDAIKGYKGNKPQAALVFTCSARKAILGLNVDKEYHYLQKNMPENFPICGFYTYGEICPLENGRESYFHNGTIAVLLIGEE